MLQNKKLPATLLLTSIVGISIFVVFHSLQRDLWNDEIYSLKHFVLTAYSTTLTDYHVPNNHVWSNLLYNIYLKLLGIQDLDYLLYRPYIVRILGLVFGGVSLLFQYRIGHRLLGKNMALLGLLLSLTSIAFMSFGLDQRGYALSTALCMWLLWLLISKHSLSKIGVLIVSFLLMITVPSNLLFLVAMSTSMFLYAAWKVFFMKENWDYSMLRNMVLILIGAGLGYFFYRVMGIAVFSNEYVQHQEYFSFVFKGKYLANIIWASFTWKLLLVILLVIFYRKKISHTVLPHPIFSIIFITWLIVLLINILGNVMGPMRIFSVWVLPLQLVVLGFIYSFSQEKKHAVFNILPVIIVLGFAVEWHVLKSHLIQTGQDGNKTQDLYRQYYFTGYNPTNTILKTIPLIAASTDSIAVIDCEDYDIPVFLQAKNIPFVRYEQANNLNTNTNFPVIITNHTATHFADYSMIDSSYYHKIYLRKK